MKRNSLYIAFVALLAVAAAGQSRIDCSQMKSRVLAQPIRFCVLLPAGFDASHAKRYPILYFLHGLGESEKTLFDTGGWTLIDDLHQQHAIGDFLIVAPQGMTSFYIDSSDSKVLYSDFFLREFMPHVELKYGGRRDRATRGITGVSMGGYGALRFAFAYPELFGSVSAQSAALMADSPQRLSEALKPDTPLGNMMASVFGRPLDPAHWQENSPFALARKNKAALRRQSIYFNCGDRDEYGFEKGAEILDRELISEGVKHVFHLYPGNHGFEYFLAHIGETLEFHSRAFAKAR